MNLQRLTGPRRLAIAAGVLVTTVLACLRIATLTEPVYSSPPLRPRLLGPWWMIRYSPSWAVPVAIAVAVIGATIALLIYRPRWVRR